MKIALAQVNTTVGDLPGNVAKIIRFARQARQAGAELVIFPELSVCGYPPLDLVEKPSFLERNRQELERLAREVPDINPIEVYSPSCNLPSGQKAGRRLFSPPHLL